MKSDNIRLPTRNEWFTHLKYNKASACPETFNCNDGPRECRDQNILFCSFSRLQLSASRTTRNTMNVSQLLIGWEGFLQDFLFFPVWKQTANICFHLHQRRTVLFHSVQFHLGLKKETKKQHYHVAFLVFLTAKKKKVGIWQHDEECPHAFVPFYAKTSPLKFSSSMIFNECDSAAKIPEGICASSTTQVTWWELHESPQRRALETASRAITSRFRYSSLTDPLSERWLMSAWEESEVLLHENIIRTVTSLLQIQWPSLNVAGNPMMLGMKLKPVDDIFLVGKLNIVDFKSPFRIARFWCLIRIIYNLFQLKCEIFCTTEQKTR